MKNKKEKQQSGGKRIFQLFLVLFVFTLVGCVRIKFEDENFYGKIQVSTNWKNCTDPKLPGGVVLYICHEDNFMHDSQIKPIIEHISNKGADVALPIGTYDAFIYNDYTENLHFRNMDHFHTAEVYMESADMPPFAKTNSNVYYIGELEQFYKAQIGTFNITPEFPEYEAIVSPELKAIILEFNIPIEGIDNVAHARGNMSGVAYALNLCTGKTDVNKVANIVFDFIITDTGVTAKVKTFGIPMISQDPKDRADEKSRNILELAFILKDGSSIIGEHIFDMTENIKYEVATYGGIIPYTDIKPLIKDIRIDNGGFDIEVGGWDDVDEDLNINE